MFRVGITIKGKEPIAKNFNTKEECDGWILEHMEKDVIKKAVIVNKDNISERWIEIF